MKIGTIEINDEIGESLKKRTGFSGGSNPGSGGGNKGGGGNGPNDDDVSSDSPEIFSPAKSRILTTFLLLVVLMTFGGLIAAYVVIGTNKAQEWQPFALPLPLWISTLIILLSSISYFISERAILANDQPKAKKWLIVTTFLGGVFIASQLLSWLELTRRGLYMYGNPYVGFFYVLTAVHAVHVIGGIVALSTLLLKSWFPARNNNELLKRASIANVVGWYWHFMGVLWIVLFLLLGFWK
jgi:cytochrome c oxidase subunit 3